VISAQPAEDPALELVAANPPEGTEACGALGPERQPISPRTVLGVLYCDRYIEESTHVRCIHQAGTDLP